MRVRKITHEPDTSTGPKELWVGSQSTSNVRRVGGVCWAVYWIREEEACGGVSLHGNGNEAEERLPDKIW
jgi:hypothetical protein